MMKYFTYSAKKNKYHRRAFLFIFHSAKLAPKDIINSPQGTGAQTHDRHNLLHIFYILFKQEAN